MSKEIDQAKILYVSSKKIYDSIYTLNTLYGTNYYTNLVNNNCKIMDNYSNALLILKSSLITITFFSIISILGALFSKKIDAKIYKILIFIFSSAFITFVTCALYYVNQQKKSSKKFKSDTDTNFTIFNNRKNLLLKEAVHCKYFQRYFFSQYNKVCDKNYNLDLKEKNAHFMIKYFIRLLGKIKNTFYFMLDFSKDFSNDEREALKKQYNETFFLKRNFDDTKSTNVFGLFSIYLSTISSFVISASNCKFNFFKVFPQMFNNLRKSFSKKEEKQYIDLFESFENQRLFTDLFVNDLNDTQYSKLLHVVLSSTNQDFEASLFNKLDI